MITTPKKQPSEKQAREKLPARKEEKNNKVEGVKYAYTYFEEERDDSESESSPLCLLKK